MAEFEMCMFVVVLIGGLMSFTLHDAKPPKGYVKLIPLLVGIVGAIFLWRFSIGWIDEVHNKVPAGVYKANVMVQTGDVTYSEPADIIVNEDNTVYVTKVYWPNGGYIENMRENYGITFDEPAEFEAQDWAEYLVTVPKGAIDISEIGFWDKLFIDKSFWGILNEFIALLIHAIFLVLCIGCVYEGIWALQIFEEHAGKDKAQVEQNAKS